MWRRRIQCIACSCILLLLILVPLLTFVAAWYELASVHDHCGLNEVCFR